MPLRDGGAYHAPMDSGRPELLARALAPAAQPRGQVWPRAVYAMLWLDAVLLVAAALALADMTPALAHWTGESVSVWTLLAFAGSALTAVAAALSAFELSAPGRSSAWMLLPAPALVVWIAGSGMGCLAVPGGAELWGDTANEAGRCLAFLLMISAPLLALILFLLWRAAPRMPWRSLALGAVAAAGAAASLLAFVHPHDAGLLDLGAHAVAIAVVLGVSAVAGRFRLVDLDSRGKR